MPLLVANWRERLSPTQSQTCSTGKEAAMNRYSKLYAFSAILFAGFFANQANADTWGHIEELGHDIALKADQLLAETHHYRHTPEYGHLVSDAVQLRAKANRICSLARSHASIYYLEAALADLDARFHHLEGLFDHIEHEAAHGHGHIHGPTRHVKRLLNRVEDCIHHMQRDIAALRAHRVTRVYRRPYSSGHYSRPSCSTPYPVYRSYHGHGHSHSGITIGNDKFRFRINF